MLLLYGPHFEQAAKLWREVETASLVHCSGHFLSLGIHLLTNYSLAEHLSLFHSIFKSSTTELISAQC